MASLALLTSTLTSQLCISLKACRIFEGTWCAFYFTNSFIHKYMFNIHHQPGTGLSPGNSQWVTQTPCLRLGSLRSRPGDTNSCVSSLCGSCCQESPVEELGNWTAKVGANKGYIFQQIKHCGQLGINTAGNPGNQCRIHSSELLHTRCEGAGVFMLPSLPSALLTGKALH